MKRALVLSGGGSRGAYEIGAWQALTELGVRFDGVYGTSIGALNAALVAQGDLDRALNVWENITVSQVVNVEDEEDFSIDRMVVRKRDVIPFLVENAKYLKMDISPLEQLVRENINESRIRASGMDFGVMTVKMPQLQACPMRLQDMERGSIADWIIASASCFPVFPSRNIDGQRYVDGGYYDNLPIDMALEDGAEEIIAVELHPEHAHPEYVRMPWLTGIKPLHNLGGFLDFNPQLMRRSRMMGYYDAMKCYRTFDGFLYTFKRINALGIADEARRFAGKIARFDAEYTGKVGEGAPLIGAIEAETELKKLDWKDLWVRGLELCAQTMGFRVDAIYDPEILIGRMLKYVEAPEILNIKDESSMRSAAKNGSRCLLAWLYQYLVRNEDFSENAVKRLAEYPIETAAALFLHSIKP